MELHVAMWDDPSGPAWAGAWSHARVQDAAGLFLCRFEGVLLHATVALRKWLLATGVRLEDLKGVGLALDVAFAPHPPRKGREHLAFAFSAIDVVDIRAAIGSVSEVRQALLRPLLDAEPDQLMLLMRLVQGDGRAPPRANTFTFTKRWPSPGRGLADGADSSGLVPIDAIQAWVRAKIVKRDRHVQQCSGASHLSADTRALWSLTPCASRIGLWHLQRAPFSLTPHWTHLDPSAGVSSLRFSVWCRADAGDRSKWSSGSNRRRTVPLL